jgi:flavin-binding protein dodecin
MSDRVYRISEIVGTSGESIERAIETAVERAQKTLRNVRWFEVTNTRGYAHPDRGIEYQVTLKIGFQVDD